MIWSEIVLKLVGNGLDFFWGKLFGHVNNTSLNKNSSNNWVVMKRTDRCQLLLPPALLVDISQILSSWLANVSM